MEMTLKPFCIYMTMFIILLLSNFWSRPAIGNLSRRMEETHPIIRHVMAL